MARKRVNRTSGPSEICDQLDIAKSTLDTYVKRGCPYTKGAPGKANKYDVGEVAAWMRDNNLTGNPGPPRKSDSPDLEAARLRKENAMARNWEIRNDELDGRLVDADEVRTRWGGIGAAVRSSLESMGEQIAHLVVGKTEQDAARVINEELKRRLRVLVDGASSET